MQNGPTGSAKEITNHDSEDLARFAAWPHGGKPLLLTHPHYPMQRPARHPAHDNKTNLCHSTKDVSIEPTSAAALTSRHQIITAMHPIRALTMHQPIRTGQRRKYDLSLKDPESPAHAGFDSSQGSLAPHDRRHTY